MISLRLLKPILQTVTEGKISLHLERRPRVSAIIELKVWQNKVKVVLFTNFDIISVRWTENGQWQKKDLTYAEAVEYFQKWIKTTTECPKESPQGSVG